MRWLFTVTAVAALALAVLLLQEAPPLPGAEFDAAAIGADPAAYLARQEARVPDLRPAARKRIVWAGAAGETTDLALLYVHGFSASAEEIRPVPQRVARALGANLVFTRLTGHGRDGPAMAEASVGAWMTDMAEAMAVSRAVGRRVVVIGTSTGGTLAALAAAQPELARGMAGIAFLSPNFGLRLPGEELPRMPGFGWWGPRLVGPNWSFAPVNAEHAAHWTTEYPLVALRPMARLVADVQRLDMGRVRVPALFLFSEADRVTDPAETRAAAAAWGGPARLVSLMPGPGDDPMGHILAGEILSPGLSDRVTDAIVAWARTL